MLRKACVSLAREAGALTSIARTEASLAKLSTELATCPTAHLPVPLDYRQTAALPRFPEFLGFLITKSFWDSCSTPPVHVG